MSPFPAAYGGRPAGPSSITSRNRHAKRVVQASLETFCQKMRTTLVNPSFATTQKMLRLVVENIVVTDDCLTIHHLIPLPDVRL